MNSNKTNNNHITWFNGQITREHREENHGHKAALVWFTGLSASGKSTIAHRLEQELFNLRCSTYVFDGDNVRHGLCQDLGFSAEDRSENLRRIGEMANLFLDAGIVAITAFISPYSRDREKIKALVGEDRFFEVYVECPVEVCASRDPKGLYDMARKGIIKNFTGISDPYEPPENPSLIIHSDKEDVKESARKVLQMLKQNEILP
jgi:adenylylsulfate kinase